MKTVGAAEFKARCLRLIRQMNRDGEPLTVTNRGRPVAMLSPLPEKARSASIIGAMAGTVLAYEDPFAPAADPSEWASLR
ncbi:MAG: type II toxin-antitoxin system Phd/YefM family antitoxin [Gemmatimonadetes bacterium]|nr:type II toxin-antitoxin system Phd/YefM family antitoxin [Gemmatimonadota bacterium]MYB97770.1 type II toxin-antitoxin system Phd/YefM family antitoxin [Gemmatimonadota bacterium]MYH53750.1 type II toxin-antitoxin system Phd/YefM family antitoxin [Gemmatimonadota bacterium]MYK66378.1 type II toxin-antitoxin system Phd/YefM family antitoxin [Gemmatimonadota bacterium]